MAVTMTNINTWQKELGSENMGHIQIIHHMRKEVMTEMPDYRLHAFKKSCYPRDTWIESPLNMKIFLSWRILFSLLIHSFFMFLLINHFGILGNWCGESCMINFDAFEDIPLNIRCISFPTENPIHLPTIFHGKNVEVCVVDLLKILKKSFFHLSTY